MQAASHRARFNQRGVSVIESLCTVAVVAAVSSLAMPSFEGLRTQRALDGIAAQLKTDIHLARSEAVSRNQPIRLTFGTQTQGSCYMLHTGERSACRCSITELARCDGDAQLLRSVSVDANQPVQIRSAVASILFDPVKGTATPTATLRVVATDGRAVHQVVNLLGRVRSCALGGKIAGYKAC